MLVVVAVGKQAVAQRAQRVAVLVVTAPQAGERVVIAFEGQQADGAQGLQLIVDVAQDLIVAFAGIPQDFPNLEIGEAGAQAPQAWDSEQMVVDISRGAGAGQRPELKETVVDEVEGLGFVAEVVFAARFSGWPVLRSAGVRCIRIGTGAVGAGVVLIPNSG